ncbi:MAG: PAS domain S-box protein [Rhodospirillaceae bacterium]|nr:PAS domain S-box protein [Rhodospirillaceae bacterium]
MEKRLAALAVASARIFGAGSLKETLRITAEEARAIIGAHQAVTSLTVGSDLAQAIQSVSLSDKYAAWHGYEEQPTGAGIYSVVCRANRPMRLTQAELEAHPAWRGFGAAKDRHPPMRGWLAVPLIGRDGANLGVVQLSDKYAGEFDPNDEAVLVQLARLVSLAIENARLIEAARHAEGRFQEFAACGSDVLWETDEQHRYTFVSTRTGHQTRHPVSDYYGKTRWEQFGRGADDPIWAAHIADLEAHRPFQNFEYSFADRDGTIRYRRAAGNPVFDVDGRFRGYRGATSDVTELRRAEAAARASEERFREFASIATDWLWETDVEDRFVFFTGASGTMPDRPYGATRWEIAKADLSDPKWQAHLADIAARRPFRDFEYTRVDETGRIRTIAVNGKPIFDEGGTFRGYRGAARDVTMQREAEAEAHRADARYRNIVEAANEGVWILDADARTTFANRRMADLLGYSPGELVGRSVYDFRLKEDLSAVQVRWDQRAQGVAELREARFRRRDGSWFWALINAQPLYDDAGKFAGSIGMVTDITARKQAEAALLQSEDRFRQFAALGSDWLWETDAEHRFTFVDGPPTVAVGFALGKRRWEYGGLDPDRPEMARHRAELDLHKPFRNFEYTVVSTGGETRHFSANGEPLFGAKGEFLGYRGTTTDVTARRSAEAALQASEGRFREFAEIGSDWLWETDEQDRFTVLAGPQPTIPGRVIGRTRWEYAGADPADPHWRAHIEDIRARRPFRHFEYASRDSAGRRCFIHVSGNPVFDADGRFRGYRGTSSDVTLQREAEAKARASEEKFRDFAEVASDWLWETDSRHRLTFISGKQPPGLATMGRTIWEVVGASLDSPAWRDHVAKLEAHLPFRGFEYAAAFEPGTVLHLSSSGKPIFDAAGEFLGYRGTTTNRTNERKAEAAAAESDRKFRRIVETAHEGIWILDRNRRTLYVNPRLCEMLGYAAEEMMGREHWDFMPPSSREPIVAADAQGPLVEDTRREVCYQRKDGSLVWTLVTSTIEDDGADHPQTIIGMVVDITDRKHAEAALAASERRFRDFAEVSSDWFWETDAEHRFTYFSPSRESSQRDPSGAAIGKTRWEYAAADAQSPEWRQHIADLEARRFVRNFEYTYPRPDGTTGITIVSGLPVYDDAGDFLGYRGTATDITEMRAAEAAARASEQKFQRIVETANEGIWIVGPDQRVVFANRRIEIMLGYEPGELIGKSALTIIPPERMETALKGWEERKKGGSTRTEARHLRKDGGEIFTLASATPIFDADGTFAGAFVMFVDITERRRAQAALAESEKQLRSALDDNRSILSSISDGFVALDNEWRFTFVNQAAENIWKRDAAELTGRLLFDSLDLDPTNPFLACYLESKRTGEPVAFTAYSEIFACWLEVRGYPHLNGYTIFFHDVTDERASHRALIESNRALDAAREMNQRLFETSADIICIANRNGDLLQINPGTVTEFGRPYGELVGHNAGEFILPEDLEGVRAALRVARRSQGRQSFECRCLRANGAIVPMNWSVAWSEGEQRYYLIGRDMTERVEAEERMRRSQRLQAIGQLTGGIAHDFNNLLTVIMGNSEMLARALKNQDRLRRQAELSLTASRRAAELTAQLLAFARRQALAPEAVDPNALLGGIRELMERSLGAQIVISFTLDPAPWRCRVDPTQLETALLNLALNARDAMPNGGTLAMATAKRSVRAGEMQELAAGDYVVIEVSDTGEGMSEAVQARAFEPFFTTKEVGKGSGLGLAMVYGFAKQSGGHVAIVSAKGRGSRVTLFLPRVGAEKDTAPTKKGDAETVPLSGGAETILVVEDDSAVRELVSSELGGLGYRVLAAENGVKARAILDSDAAVDLLFSDVMMPGGINGVQLAAEAAARRPDLRILLTSGHADLPELGASLAAGAINLLRKPYRISELAHSVRRALDAAPRRRAQAGARKAGS